MRRGTVMRLLQHDCAEVEIIQKGVPNQINPGVVPMVQNIEMPRPKVQTSVLMARYPWKANRCKTYQNHQNNSLGTRDVYNLQPKWNRHIETNTTKYADLRRLAVMMLRVLIRDAVISRVVIRDGVICRGSGEVSRVVWRRAMWRSVVWRCAVRRGDVMWGVCQENMGGVC